MAAPVEGAAFPLRVGASNRYLVDQAGTPFLVQADSPWDMIAGLNNNDVNQYLADRQSKGFNTLIVELMEHQFQSASNRYAAPTNNYGQPPFLVPGDFSTPNEAYFTNADWVIDQAAARGMVVVLFPCFLGFPNSGQGWYNEMLANGAQKCKQYGQYVGNRYKNKPNIIWAMYGDHDPNSSIQPMVDALSAGILSVDTNHLFTAQCQRNSVVRDLLAGDSAWLQLNTVYSDSLTYEGCLTAYAKTPAMPFFMIEGYYEGENGSTPQSMRAQAYWANLSGACGQTFGNNPVWGFFPGWQSALNSVGANDMMRVDALFLSRPWTNLVPDAANIVLTGGYGNYGSSNYVTAALAVDGATMIACLPAGGAVTVNLTRLSGTQAQAWWYNPRGGSAASIGSFPTTNSRSFQAPTTDDWILVIDDSSRGFSVPGLAVLTTSVPNGTVGDSYAAQLTASGGSGAYTWSAVSNGLPSGLTLSTGGLLSGTPSAQGSFGPIVHVTDSNNQTASGTLQIVVISPIISLSVSAQNTGQIRTNGFTVGLNADTSGTYVIEATTNFNTWQPVQTVQYTNGLMPVLIPVSPAPARFFRARLQSSGATPIIALVVPSQTADQIATNGFAFYLTANIPGTYVIETSADLRSWQAVQTLQYVSGQLHVTVPAGLERACFVRARTQ